MATAVAPVEEAASEEEGEVSPELRAAHEKAFEEAVAVLENELQSARVPGRVVALLTGVRNEFEAWEDGQIDGPMPPLATPELLRSKFKYVFVGEAAWKQATNYTTKTVHIFDSHMGGGTSMSGKLFALFGKGVTKVRSSLRSGAHENALCDAIMLTKAMVSHDDWWGDTDMPEVTVHLVKSLAAVWAKVLASSLEQRDMGMLKSWLEAARQQWEGEAAEHLGTKLTFDYCAPTSVPGNVSEAVSVTTPRKATSKQAESLSASKGKKRKLPLEPGDEPAKDPRRVLASADTEAWLHRLDGQLMHRQASAVQLRCEAEGCGKKRALVVTGSYPLRAVSCAVAEAFGMAAGEFDPHPNKTKTPPGLRLALQREGGQQPLKPTLKIVQAVQEPGDSMRVEMDGLVVVISLDAIKFKSDASYDVIKERPMPRCVGGDAGLGPRLLKRLNRIFLHDRKPIDFLCCSKSEKISSTLDHMARPIALGPGEPLVESRGFGFGRPGEVPGDSLRPIVI